MSYHGRNVIRSKNNREESATTAIKILTRTVIIILLTRTRAKMRNTIKIIHKTTSAE